MRTIENVSQLLCALELSRETSIKNLCKLRKNKRINSNSIASENVKLASKDSCISNILDIIQRSVTVLESDIINKSMTSAAQLDADLPAQLDEDLPAQLDADLPAQLDADQRTIKLNMTLNSSHDTMRFLFI